MTPISNPIANPRARVILGDSRWMQEVQPESVDLVVTSPPYWHLKDYGVEGQIGYGQSLHDYLKSLCRVWMECLRVLKPSRRLCINIGDQFARQVVYGRYKVIPLHSEIISQCEALGFDYMGSIIWQKKTTMETSGGAVVMGSYPYPPNGIVELDYEYILLFKKPGPAPKVSPEIKEQSRLTKEEWKEYFSGHWRFAGARQQGHEAMFPEELPKRLTRMFTFIGETVLDPFLGSGATLRTALHWQRRAIGYEINPDFLPLIQQKIAIPGEPGIEQIQFLQQKRDSTPLVDIPYSPTIQDAAPQIDPGDYEARQEPLYKVVDVINESTLRIDSGEAVRFLGVKINQPADTIEYLKKSIVGKKVYIRPGNGISLGSGTTEAYVYLKNKIFVNLHLIRSGLASNDPSIEHRLAEKFAREEQSREEGERNRV